MGTTYTYTCQSCRYAANVSGGRDFGFVGSSQTGFCTVCNELVDYVAEICHGDGKIEQGMVIGACHRCQTQVTQDWNEGDACPRCGGNFGKPVYYEDWD